jgi:acyl dehydratase
VPIDYTPFVGQRETLDAVVAQDAVERFCQAIRDDHPEHRGEAAVAPPTYAFALAMGVGERPFPFDPAGLIHAEQRFAFDRPLVVGARLTLHRGLTQARRRGEGDSAAWLLTWEARALDPDGESVFGLSARLLARPARPPVGDGGGARDATGPAPAEATAAPPTVETTDTADTADTADTLDGPSACLDAAWIRAYADASGDRNPIHLDAAAARAHGLDGVVAHGMLSLALIARRAEEWAAADGLRLETLQARFVAPVAAGETVRVRGRRDDPAGAEATFWLEGPGGAERVRARARRGPAF